MVSRGHKKKAKEQIRKEIMSAGSLRNYLVNKEFLTKRKTNLNRIRYYLYVNSIKQILN